MAIIALVYQTFGWENQDITSHEVSYKALPTNIGESWGLKRFRTFNCNTYLFTSEFLSTWFLNKQGTDQYGLQYIYEFQQ